MNARIEFDASNYGFEHNWTLVVKLRSGLEKSFYLGQDVKFCNRILGISPAYIAEEIGSREITEDKVNKKLAKFIVKQLGLTSKNVKQLNSWDLCAQ